MRILIALSITVLLAAPWSRAAEDPWKEYKNARFGFLLRYPASLVGSRAPDNGGGREYHTRDNKFFVSAASVAGFQITYPHAKNKKYDPWVERIAKEFVPFLDGDYDRIK